MGDYHSGQLVEIDVDRIYTDDNLCTAAPAIDGSGAKCAQITETINFRSYPSCKDFLGEKSTVRTGEVGTILRKVGRPMSIRGDDSLDAYDVYEILIDAGVRQVFKFNLRMVQRQGTAVYSIF